MPYRLALPTTGIVRFVPKEDEILRLVHGRVPKRAGGRPAVMPHTASAECGLGFRLLTSSRQASTDLARLLSVDQIPIWLLTKFSKNILCLQGPSKKVLTRKWMELAYFVRCLTSEFVDNQSKYGFAPKSTQGDVSCYLGCAG